MPTPHVPAPTALQAPTKPSISPELRSLLDGATERKGAVDADGDFYTVETGFKPPAVSDEQARSLAERTLPSLNAALAPAAPAWIAARVTALLAHYFVPSMPGAVQEAVLDDWVEALASFPAWAVDEAVREWQRTQPKKPTIADIVTRCQKAVRPYASDREKIVRTLEARESRERAGAPSTPEKRVSRERAEEGFRSLREHLAAVGAEMRPKPLGGDLPPVDKHAWAMRRGDPKAADPKTNPTKTENDL